MPDSAEDMTPKDTGDHNTPVLINGSNTTSTGCEQALSTKSYSNGWVLNGVFPLGWVIGCSTVLALLQRHTVPTFTQSGNADDA